MKKQTSIVERTYQELKKVVDNFNKTERDNETIVKEKEENDKTLTIKKYNNIKLIFYNKLSFYKCQNIKKSNKFSFKSKYSFQPSFITVWKN